MAQNEQLRLHAYIKGRVQGVGFRYHTLKSAQKNDLTGWVRNLPDGRVEVVAEGEHQALNNLLIDIRKGPISAEVEDVNYEFSEPKGEFHQFRVKGLTF